MNDASRIARIVDIAPRRVAAAIDLLDDGNTLPFIARYRKEKTDGLDEEALRQIQASLSKLRTLDSRRQTILQAIEAQGKLDDALRRKIEAADNTTLLEDLYQPYKQKRKTRAGTARDKGLQPLADQILAQSSRAELPVQLAKRFISADVPTVDEALAGARDIVAEMMSEHAAVRGQVREKALRFASLKVSKVKKAEDPKSIYKLYYEFEIGVSRVRPHQLLAINRGEAEKILRVQVEFQERDWLLPLRAAFRPNRQSPLAEQLQMAMTDSAARLLLPAISRDVRRALNEQAEAHAIEVFGTNLRGLLNQPPLTARVILGLDPAYRTGCKLAVVDPTGKLLATETIYPHQPQRKWKAAGDTIAQLIARYDVSIIAIGNGTASRESEQLVAELIANDSRASNCQYLLVNEAGASVYSASPLARAELPELDVSLRGAVSIARRVQDPMAELVKIDPKSIGVGMYQHDVDDKELAEALDAVVESAVNRVGVDVNTASPALLKRISGIGPKLAENIVAYREHHGKFGTREALSAVAGLGPKAYEQAAGFLRVNDGSDPLDMSAIHPESYSIAKRIMRQAGISMDLEPAGRQAALAALRQRHSFASLAQSLNTGIPTLVDIFDQLIQPGRDPRQDAPAPLLRSDVLKIDDLQQGMGLKGTVRNVVDFGAFIDIGVKQDGLLHRSKMPRSMKLTVGDVIEVEILSVDKDRNRISLGIDA